MHLGKKSASSLRGFSLLELLLVTALIPLISFVIFANFSSAMRLWQRFEVRDQNESIAIFSIKTGRDLGQGFRYSGQKFRGEPQEFALMSIIEADPAIGGDLAVGQVVYRFDPSKKVLLRESRNLSDLAKERPGQVLPALQDVTGFKATYLVWDKIAKTFVWVEEVTEELDTLPAAVRFDMVLAGPEGSRDLSRTFHIPSGG